jgi:hypothetical protein
LPVGEGAGGRVQAWDGRERRLGRYSDDFDAPLPGDVQRAFEMDE